MFDYLVFFVSRCLVMLSISLWASASFEKVGDYQVVHTDEAYNLSTIISIPRDFGQIARVAALRALDADGRAYLITTENGQLLFYSAPIFTPVYTALNYHRNDSVCPIDLAVYTLSTGEYLGTYISTDFDDFTCTHHQPPTS